MKERSLEVARTKKPRKQRPRRVFTLAAASSWRTRRRRRGERLLYTPLFAAFSFAGEYKPPFRSASVAEASLSRIPMLMDMGSQGPFSCRVGLDWISSLIRSQLKGWGGNGKARSSLARKGKKKKPDQPIGARLRGPALWLVGEGLSGLASGLVHL